MCNWCEPDGWKRRTCNVCGDERGTDGAYLHPAVISISIATDDPESRYPFTTTDMCLECGRKYPMARARDHNDASRKIAGLTPLDL